MIPDWMGAFTWYCCCCCWWWPQPQWSSTFIFINIKCFVLIFICCKLSAIYAYQDAPFTFLSWTGDDDWDWKTWMTWKTSVIHKNAKQKPKCSSPVADSTDQQIIQMWKRESESPSLSLCVLSLSLGTHIAYT